MFSHTKSEGKAMLVIHVHKGVQQWSFFCIFEIFIFCFVVAIFDLVHDVKATFYIP